MQRPPERRGRHDDELRRAAAGAGRVPHGDRRSCRRADPADHRHRRHTRAAVPAEASLDRIAADHRDRLEVVRQRQDAARILEEHDRRARRFTRQCPMGHVAVPVGGAVGVHVGMLEQAERELHAQHARHGAVDHGARDQSAAEGVEVRAVLLVGRLKHHVEAGVERVHDRRRRARLRVLQNGRARRRRRIRDHEAREAPVALQNAGEQRAVLRRGNPADGVVGRHDRAGVCRGDRVLERREEALRERALIPIGGIAVAPAFPDVGHEMLRRGHDARLLECRHERAPHFAGEVGIFAVRLLDPAPAHVARDVQHGRQHLADAAALRFPCDGARHAADEPAVPGRRERHGLREHGRSGPRETVHCLIEWNDRDAEARALDEVPLDAVDSLGVGARTGTRVA